MTAQFNLKLVYRGGDADQNRLDLYDGADSLFGFSKVLEISAHAFVNNSITHHATAARGVKFYRGVPSAGSFVEPIQAIITDPNFMAGLTTGVIGNAFYDFLKFSIGRAAGLAVTPETATVRDHLERDEPFFDELADVMELPLAEGHRTIKRSGGTVALERPRSTLLTFNKETLDWVTTREIDDVVETRMGNVTRYNRISKNGRFYDTKLERIVPFKADKSLGIKSQRLLSRSLDEANNRLPGMVEFSVKPVLSARGTIKRYILMSCTQPGRLGGVSGTDRV